MRWFSHLAFVLLLGYGLQEDVHTPPALENKTKTCECREPAATAVVFFHAGIGLPGRENLFVLKLLHAGGGSHRHGDYYVVDVEGAFTSPPLDWLLLENKGGV